MASAVVSVLSGRPVRHDLAMTGEITLSGRVLPIGGLKEKILGAVRAGITEILLPKENESDLEDLPAEVRERIRVHPVERVGRGARDRAAGSESARRPAALPGRRGSHHDGGAGPARDDRRTPALTRSQPRGRSPEAAGRSRRWATRKSRISLHSSSLRPVSRWSPSANRRMRKSPPGERATKRVTSR